MAIYQPSMWLPLISGSVGSTTFSNNSGGHYVKNKSNPTNPGTIRQTIIRGYLAQMAQAWRNLTEAQRLQWNGAAINFPYTDPFGDVHTYSGEVLFIKLGVNLLNIGLAFLTVPPTPQSSVNFNALSGAATFNVIPASSTFTMVFAPTPTPSVALAQSTLVYATAGLSPGISNFNTRLRQIGVLAAGTASPTNIAPLYIAKFGNVPSVGSKIGFGLVPIRQVSGQEGLIIKASLIVT